MIRGIWSLISIQSVSQSSFSSKRSQCLHSKTVRARELKFWGNVHLPPHVVCHVTCVTRYMSCVTFSPSIFFRQKSLSYDFFATQFLLVALLLGYIIICHALFYSNIYIFIIITELPLVAHFRVKVLKIFHHTNLTTFCMHLNRFKVKKNN